MSEFVCNYSRWIKASVVLNLVRNEEAGIKNVQNSESKHPVQNWVLILVQ